MKRIGNLYHQIPYTENLHIAFYKAAKGKRMRPDVLDFKRNFHANIATLRQQLLDDTVDVGHYRFFHVRDPKQRLICAASFPERVLHHAIMNVCGPGIERCAIDDSYACRRRKGPRKAVKKARKFSKRYPWYLKLDICRYFDSIDHDIAVHLLSRRFKEKRLIRLFRRVLDTYHTIPGKGVPIGNLISQNLANFYMSGFDHGIKEIRRIQGYIRYMDDFLLFGNTRDNLKQELEYIKNDLDRNLKLVLKDDIQLNRCTRGIPFLGYRVFPNKVRLSPQSRKRFVKKFRLYERRWIDGVWDVDELIKHTEPLFDFTMASHSREFRKQVLQRYGVSS